jgi:hypothetical protein
MSGEFKIKNAKFEFQVLGFRLKVGWALPAFLAVSS